MCRLAETRERWDFENTFRDIAMNRRQEFGSWDVLCRYPAVYLQAALPFP